MFLLNFSEFKKMATVLLCVAMLVSFISCGNDNSADIENNTAENEELQQENVTQPEPEITPETSKDENQDENETDETIPQWKNTLTGLPCTEQIANQRPVAIMINNLKEALPQMGISEAKILYEILAEGGITRHLAIYNDYNDIAEIGSIRSARDYYIDIADAHDAIFVHAGQSESAKQTLYSRNTNNINGNFMYRSAERRKTMAYEHTLMMKGEDLTKAISAAKYRNTSDMKQPLEFYDSVTVPEAEDAVYVEVPFHIGKNGKPYAVSFFNFDKNSGLYSKGHYEKDHIDGDDGSVLTFNNVIVLECAHANTGDSLGHITVNFTGTGKGKLFTMGKYKDIVWKRQSRTSSYTLYESDGETPLKVNPGKSYIGLVPKGTTITTK